MPEYLAKVSCEDSNTRLDLFILRFSRENKLGLSRTSIQKMIVGKMVKLSGSSDLKPHQKVKTGDEVVIAPADKKQPGIAAEDIPLEIVYEDDDLAVINKPVGLVVHPAPGNYEHTLVNALLHYFSSLSDINPKRPGIVHRLDKETSGLMVVIKNNETHLDMARQFEKHSIERKYVAVVKGVMSFDENIIEASIGRHPVKREKMAVGFSEKNRYAKTYYRTLRRGKDISLLELRPFTGRTHQLRVHLAFIGHPIIGDDKYGRRQGFGRMFLHAQEIGFVHPRTKKLLRFSSVIPREFNDLFNQ